jgi:hypothetical protein
MAESLGWLAPAPLWDGGGAGLESSQLVQPFLTELKSDQFVAEFLGVLGAQAGASPPDLATMAPDTTNDGTATGLYRLFQPLSQRYYLVTASLVCRRAGVPDRAVQRSKGERTTFVLRQVASDGSELAWVPATGSAAKPGAPPTGKWVTAAPGQLAAGEEQLPMHAAPVAGFADPGTTAAAFGMSEPGRRTVHYGYIPTGRRDRLVTPLADTDAVNKLLSIDPSQQQAVILGDLVSRVIQPWGVLQGTWPPPAPEPVHKMPDTDTDYSSLYVLLDLNDWLQTHLPSVYKALISGTTVSGQAANDLLQGLTDAQTAPWVGTRGAPPEQPPPPPKDWTPGTPTLVPLSQALQALANFGQLVTGADMTAPPDNYDLTAPAVPQNWLLDSKTGPPNSMPPSLAFLALAALTEANATPTVPAELSGMIKADPTAPTPGYSPDTYIIRTVFEHDPCVPVLSQPSRPFQLARPTDGDAPARQIRIALPDISNLRQFKRGVAIEMPPSLRRMLDRVTPAMLQGKGLGPDPGVELGMICSFSIQIMWVLSFMVMFLFVISFNIIFWWMAFIKICFPIPVPSQPKSGGPPSP